MDSPPFLISDFLCVTNSIFQADYLSGTSPIADLGLWGPQGKGSIPSPVLILQIQEKSFDQLPTPWMNQCGQKLTYCDFVVTTVARKAEHPNVIENAFRNREWEGRTQECRGLRENMQHHLVLWKIIWASNYFFLYWLQRCFQISHSEDYLSLQVSICTYLKFNSNLSIPKTESENPSIEVLWPT